jgi:nucleoside-diphosphate-sugar epimerase
MKKILVTGATGFIGTYVVETLLRKGCTVVASSSKQEHAHTAPWWGKAEYKPFDLASFDPSVDYYAYFGRPDSLVHLAWEGLPHYKQSFHLEINYPSHAAFLRNMLSYGLSDLTVTGTCLEYGMQEGCLREDFPAQPAIPYAMAKNELRLFLEKLGEQHGFIYKWVRLFYVYGKGQNSNSLLSQLDRALENGEKVFNMSLGEQLRDFMTVEQAADHIGRIAMQDKINGVINCCSGIPISVKELVLSHMSERNKFILLNLGYYPYPDYEPMRFWGDSSKLKTIR